MQVYYMNGAGNDFMVLDARGKNMDFSALSLKLCAMRGADGFMAVDYSDCADFRLHFYNADGTRGEMCGNGSRCICRFANELGIAGETMTVQTDAGIIRGVHTGGGNYRVKLNNPGILDLNRLPGIAYVELGNPGVPHAVREYKGDLWADAESLKDEMQSLRRNEAFPKGANVNYYQFIGDSEVRMLTFERGVEDFTLACGTGCGSTACVLALSGRLPGGTLTCHNRGGDLILTVDGCVDSLLMEGPTEITEILDLNL